MSATELGAVEALLERVLPDPRGFAERVFNQLVERVAPDPRAGEEPGDVTAYDSTASEVLSDRNVLFAAAVGACECWGEDPACPDCAGRGSPGWSTPDARLYAEYVEPAVQKSTEPKPAGDSPPIEGAPE